MKTYIYRTLFIGVLVSSYLTHSQIRPNNNRGEYLRFDEIKDLKKRSTGETEFEDFSFNWDNGFHTALNNQILLKLARKKAKRVWFKRQKKRVRENIEKKLGRNFDNYDQAKEALFLFSEKENIYRNSKPPINKYQSLRSDGYAISKGYLKELKLLQLRKIEINAGNIHNPKYGYLKANGMLLKDIKDLNTLNQKWDNIVIPLGSNINNTHYNTSIYQKLNNLGADFNTEIIALKNNYYNRFNRWEQLNLMQLLLNFEEYKRLSSCGVCLLPSSFYKFKELDKATSRVIETYAMNNRDKRTSIFDTTIDYYGGYGRYIQWMQSRRQEAINKLVNEVHTARFAAENLISELKITDNSQKNWLYSGSNSIEVSNLIDFLQKNRVHGVVAVEAVNFAKEVVKAGEEGILVSAFPFVKYPVGSNYATLYPKLTEYLKNQLPTIKNNQTIINKIVEYGDLSASEVKSQLEWGKGPEIQIKQLGVHYGLFNGNYPNVLNLDIDLINDLENSTPNSRLANSFAFLVGVTILHEFVHYSEYTDSRWNNPESGELFEIDVYGQTVWRNNASIILKRN